MHPHEKRNELRKKRKKKKKSIESNDSKWLADIDVIQSCKISNYDEVSCFTSSQVGAQIQMKIHIQIFQVKT